MVSAVPGEFRGLWEPVGADPGSEGAGVGRTELGTDEKGLEVWLDGEAVQDPEPQRGAQASLLRQWVPLNLMEPCWFPGCHPCPGSPNFLLLLQEYIQKLMPPLIQKWNELKDEDKDLFPLLEVGDLQTPSCSPAPPLLS